MDRKDAALAVVIGAMLAMLVMLWDNVIETLMNHEHRITGVEKEVEGHGE